MSAMVDRYSKVGRLSGEEWEQRDPGMGVVAAGSTWEPIWGCDDCGAVVWLRDVHDRFHQRIEAREGIAASRAALEEGQGE